MKGVAPLRTTFTPIERTAIGELLELAQRCSESENPSVRTLAGLAMERAANIMRGEPLHTWSDRDIANFGEHWSKP